MLHESDVFLRHGSGHQVPHFGLMLCEEPVCVVQRSMQSWECETATDTWLVERLLILMQNAQTTQICRSWQFR